MDTLFSKCRDKLPFEIMVTCATVWFLCMGLCGFTATAAHSTKLTSVLPVAMVDTLPIVIHVVHTGTPVGSSDNPSDSLIMEMLTLLNAAYNKDGPNYGGADMELFFQLATRSPDCTGTTGINRVDGSSVPNYATGGITFDTMYNPNSAHEIYVKALSRWPNTDYLNIWIVNMIDGDPDVPGGYSWFPEYNSALVDGIVIQASVVSGTNKTLVHEMGHAFQLYHPFNVHYMETDCDDTDCIINGDEVCDTEPCLFTLDCLSTINPCSGQEWLIADTAHGYTVVNNHMGYADCAWMFTEGQKTRVHSALLSFRPGLLSSGGLEVGVATPPIAACVPDADNGLSIYYGIERVEMGALEVYSNTSDADGAFYIDHTCNQRLEVVAGDGVLLRITGSYENYQQIRAYCDFNDNGIFDLPGELLLSADGGIVEDSVQIPPTAVLCTPLRLRVVSELPGAPAPGPCHLTGTAEEGVGQIEDYTVVVLPRQVYSLSSGDWDDPAVWSCNCVPGTSDAVTLSASHQITVTPAMGLILCASVFMEDNAGLNLSGEIQVSGGCGY